MRRRTASAIALVLTSVVTAFSASEAAAATFTVTNTANSGAGSLRQAITDANNAAGRTRSISTSLLALSVHDHPASSLPADHRYATIDATTQPGFSGLTPRPVVELDGTLAGSTTEGLTIGAASTPSEACD